MIEQDIFFSVKLNHPPDLQNFDIVMHFTINNNNHSRDSLMKDS